MGSMTIDPGLVKGCPVYGTLCPCRNVVGA
jgi:hypothetical protein